MPSLPDVRAWLAGSAALADPAALAFVDRFRSTLLESERTLLELSDVPEALEPVRTAIAIQCRLELALATRPEPLISLSSAALESLLAESDHALAGLTIPAEADASTHTATEAVRSALVRAAVQLTESAAEVSKDPKPTPAKRDAPPRTNSVTRMVAVEARTPSREARRQRLILGAFVLVLLGAAAFHGNRWLHRPVAPPPSDGFPPGVTAFTSASGVTVIQFDTPALAKDPALRKQLEQRADAEGKQLIEPARGQLMMVPSSTPPESPHAP